MQILVVDDDPDLRTFLCHALEMAGWGVTAVATSAEAITECCQRTEKPDLVVLDVGLPDSDGWNTIVAIRSCASVPIIMLTARDSRLDTIRGLDLGADDYITKPFDFLELRARIDAVTRRSRPSRTQEERALSDYCPHLVIRADCCAVTYAGKDVALSPKEFRVLALLASRPGCIFTAEEILNEVWADSDYATPEDVAKYVFLIRKRFREGANLRAPIANKRGFGYYLNDGDSK